MTNCQQPVECEKHGAYTDAAGDLHFMQPGDVLPADARAVSVAFVDCFFENDAPVRMSASGEPHDAD